MHEVGNQAHSRGVHRSNVLRENLGVCFERNHMSSEQFLTIPWFGSISRQTDLR